MIMEKKTLIILTGPTAVGKTELSIGLAKAIDGEIISADSMQVYKGMDIGTAKISKQQMKGVKHWLIDELSPKEEFNVNVFKKKCDAYMEDIYSRGKIPILVGGTGFYIQAVLYDIDFEETDADNSYRNKLQNFAEIHGAEALHDELKKIDPESAKAIHPNNVKRVIRAIEYFEQTGEQISKHNERERNKESPYSFRYYVLSLPRDILYERINKRVDIMRDMGLEDEVKRLLSEGCTKDMVSMQGLGYKEIIDALEGNITIDEAFEKIKKETRHFAKRQFTWFKREKNVTWLDKEKFDESELLDYIVNDIKKMINE
ncbi:MAG: tRNA (adenosine(37)-N6)-dimethylallyltransferase MiaA [Lachnospiraceae bacterium]|nr:tRNA (adenosine(37)-N6)-dimethylallyltransferase MiaA [Lachnospiraceae bacterium]